MNTPIILLVGQAGSGKDTVAGFLVENHGAIAIAQADPMKRLASDIFWFTEDQLWGPSSSRNAVDAAFNEPNAWVVAEAILDSKRTWDWIKRVLPGLNEYGLTQAHRALRNWFGSVKAATFDQQKGLTPRLVLQTLGTEWGRRFSRNMWVDYAKDAALKLLSGGFRYDRTQGLIEDESFVGPGWVIITDGRFRNEVVSVLALGGSVVKIESVETGAEAEAAGVRGHKSETEQKSIPHHFFTTTFHNDKSKGLKHAEFAATALLVTLIG